MIIYFSWTCSSKADLCGVHCPLQDLVFLQLQGKAQKENGSFCARQRCNHIQEWCDTAEVRLQDTEADGLVAGWVDRLQIRYLWII